MATTDKKNATPAQDYAAQMIAALDNVIAMPGDIDAENDVLMIALSRPKTLRAALAAYLYKAQHNNTTWQERHIARHKMA